MADINDPQNYAEGLANELDRLSDAPIDDEDRQAIRRMVQHAE